MWILSFQLSTDIELNCQTATVYTTSSHGLIHSSLQRNLFSKHSPFGCHKQFSVNTEPQSPVENDRFILGEADSHFTPYKLHNSLSHAVPQKQTSSFAQLIYS